MLTTKAYVTKVPDDGDNIFKVNVPLMMDNTETPAEFEAIVSNAPGIFKGIEVGDCVIVDFEDDKYDMAIILGKLFTEVPSSTSAFGLFNQLEVTGSVKLPNDTKIGDFTPQDIFNLYQGVENETGGGSGTINPEDLKQYVQWTPTERNDSEIQGEVFADHIRIMTGEEYDELLEDPSLDQDLFNKTLYFLSSLPESEILEI